MIHFIDVDGAFSSETQKLFAGDQNCVSYTARVESLERGNTAFVSPANSIGFMDGGIDLIYSRVMFPGVEQRVRAKVRNIGAVNQLGRRYLPIGSAMLTVVDEIANTALITSPTMLLPQPVQTTRNAYYSMFAALSVVTEWNKRCPVSQRFSTLVVPALCCGYGGMSAAQAASQVHRAHVDFGANPDRYPAKATWHMDGLTVLFEHPLEEQPPFYENTEWFEVPLERITMRNNASAERMGVHLL